MSLTMTPPTSSSGVPGVCEVDRENAGLEPEERIAHAAHGVLEVAEREGDDERRERLVRPDLRGQRDVP
jgi:hypothetical protein